MGCVVHYILISVHIKVLHRKGIQSLHQAIILYYKIHLGAKTCVALPVGLLMENASFIFCYLTFYRQNQSGNPEPLIP